MHESAYATHIDVVGRDSAFRARARYLAVPRLRVYEGVRVTVLIGQLQRSRDFVDDLKELHLSEGDHMGSDAQERQAMRDRPTGTHIVAQVGQLAKRVLFGLTLLPRVAHWRCFQDISHIIPFLLVEEGIELWQIKRRDYILDFCYDRFLRTRC